MFSQFANQNGSVAKIRRTKAHPQFLAMTTETEKLATRREGDVANGVLQAERRGVKENLA